MGIVLQNISSTSFTKSLTHEYRLSLILGIDGISYMIVDGIDKVVTFKRFSIKEENKVIDIKTIFSGDEKLLHNYKSIKIGIESHSFTLIPNRLFNEDDSGLYLDKTSKQSSKILFNNDPLSFNQSKLVYSINAEIISVLKNYFPSGKMYHSVSPLLNGWRKQSEVKEGKKIFINVDSNYFTIAFFDAAELMFINRFHYQTAGDFLYYVLMIYDRFELKPESTPCFLSGFILTESEIYKKLFSYIRHLQFLTAIPYYDFSDGFNHLTHHNHFELYSMKLCES